MKGLYISAAHKSSGKTTITMGLCAALRQQGLTVQPFKKGPDYIDPMWLTATAGRSCYNLDFNSQSKSEILETFNRHSAEADISIVEGNKGLFDGMDVHGRDCNAALAKLIGLRIVLVLDVQGIIRGVAPLLNGYQAFDPDLEYAGVILNKVASARHEKKLRDVIREYTDFEVLGAVYRDDAMIIPEKPLGLATYCEGESADVQISDIVDRVKKQVNVSSLTSREGDVTPGRHGNVLALRQPECRSGARVSGQHAAHIGDRRTRIAVARDCAFCFYYPDDLKAIQESGVEIAFFSPASDNSLPEAEALFIGGGFPERYCEQLESNHSMRKAVRDFVDSGSPVYAECGGLMYLSRSIQCENRKYEMAGVIPADVEMRARPVGRGYVSLRTTPDFPWAVAEGTCWKAHEFHYSNLVNLDPDLKFGYAVQRGHGIDGVRDGIVMGNLFASYAHLRDTDSIPWVEKFVEYVLTNTRSNVRPAAGNIVS